MDTGLQPYKTSACLRHLRGDRTCVISAKHPQGSARYNSSQVLGARSTVVPAITARSREQCSNKKLSLAHVTMQLQLQQQGTQHNLFRLHLRFRCTARRALLCTSQEPTTTVLRTVAPVHAANLPIQPLNPIKKHVRKLLATADANVSLQESLLDYICAGPLLEATGITVDQVKQHLLTWEKLGRQLALQLGFEHNNMNDTERLRVYQYYLPVFFWVQQQMQQHKLAFNGQQAPPLVLGISAPQGCGKSTLVEQLEQLFTWLGVTAASVSIDDFYLTNADQTALAAAYPGNRLLALRGNAGTHDLELGRRTLQLLKGLTQQGATAAVPRYDKSAFQGRGDRADPATWPVITGPLELVFFEGWMSGFRPVGPEAAAAVEDSLVEVDKRLAEYESAWDSWVDSWLVIRIDDPQWVFGWRLQAEQRMRAAGKPGMTDEQIADFVSRYIPAYNAYLPGMYVAGPTTARAGHTLIIEVDQHRSPVTNQPKPLLLPCTAAGRSGV